MNFIASLIVVLGIILVVILAVAAIWSILALILLVAWNFVMPAIFGLPVLTFAYSFAIILILSVIGSFFKSVSK